MGRWVRLVYLIGQLTLHILSYPPTLLPISLFSYAEVRENLAKQIIAANLTGYPA